MTRKRRVEKTPKEADRWARIAAIETRKEWKFAEVGTGFSAETGG